LDRRGIRSKPRRLSNGRTIGGGGLGVGGLAPLLQKRFFIGEGGFRGGGGGGGQAPDGGGGPFRGGRGQPAAPRRPAPAGGCGGARAARPAAGLARAPERAPF